MVQAFINLDKVKSTAHIESIVAPKDGLKAGQFVTLGTVSDEHDGEILNFTPTAAKGKVDGLVAPVHLDYGYGDFDEANQEVKEGKVARVLVIERGDMISFHKEMMPKVVVGDKLAIDAKGFSLVKAAVDEEAVAIALAERYMPNVGDVVLVRFV